MMCQSTGRPPTSTIGFGRTLVSSEMRVPNPPARMTAFIERTSSHKLLSQRPSAGVSVLSASNGNTTFGGVDPPFVEETTLLGSHTVRTMRVLITGHDGYIGTRITPMFLDAGHDVVGLDSFLYE